MIWKIFSLSTICSLLVVSAHSQSSQSLRSGFDQPCNKTLRCKSQSWLTCDNETAKCRCARSDEMIYDESKQKCVALIGEQCKFGFGEGTGTDAWYDRADCVNGSSCGPSGICTCRDGYFEDIANNKCSPLKDHGQSCGSKYECNQDKFLNCIQGQCLCDPDNAIYNRVEFYESGYGNVPSGICIGRVGTKCSRNSRPPKYCIKNSQCDGTVCKCSSSYTETSERLCGLGYNQPCSDNNVCSDKLRCSGFKDDSSTYHRQAVKCSCPHKTYQIYDSSLSSQSTCRGLVGAPCDPNDDLSCIDKAVCIERDGIFQCECDDGFIDTENGKCQIAFGATCNYINQGSITFTNMCDEHANLQCKGGKCSCENEADIYEPEHRQCRSPVGIRCKGHGQCVANSHCAKPGNNFWGRCACNVGFSVTKNHTCVISTEVDDSIEETPFEDIEFDYKNTTTSPM